MISGTYRNGQENNLIVSFLFWDKKYDHGAEVLRGNKVEPSRWFLWEELVSLGPKKLSLLCHATKG